MFKINGCPASNKRRPKFTIQEEEVKKRHQSKSEERKKN